jgi:hypothetical protein
MAAATEAEAPIIRHPAPEEAERAYSIFQQPWWLDAVAPGIGARSHASATGG